MSTARIVVHVVPRAKTTGLAGTHGDAIRIRIAAPPADGAANVALLRFLADQLDVPVSRVRITAGATGRRKVIEVDGVSEERVRRALMADG